VSPEIQAAVEKLPPLSPAQVIRVAALLSSVTKKKAGIESDR
jgi:hypothetical protein